MQPRNKRVRIPVALLRPLSDKYKDKGINLIPPSKASVVFFYKDDFGIKLPTMVNMPLNKETKPLTKWGILGACTLGLPLIVFIHISPNSRRS